MKHTSLHPTIECPITKAESILILTAKWFGAIVLLCVLAWEFVHSVTGA